MLASDCASGILGPWARQRSGRQMVGGTLVRNRWPALVALCRRVVPKNGGQGHGGTGAGQSRLKAGWPVHDLENHIGLFGGPPPPLHPSFPRPHLSAPPPPRLPIPPSPGRPSVAELGPPMRRSGWAPCHRSGRPTHGAPRERKCEDVKPPQHLVAFERTREPSADIMKQAPRSSSQVGVFDCYGRAGSLRRL